MPKDQMIINNGLIGKGQHKRKRYTCEMCPESQPYLFLSFSIVRSFQKAMATTDIKKVVILGGGAAGLLIAMKLGPEKKKHGIDVTLVDCKVCTLSRRNEAIH